MYVEFLDISINDLMNNTPENIWNYGTPKLWRNEIQKVDVKPNLGREEEMPLIYNGVSIIPAFTAYIEPGIEKLKKMNEDRCICSLDLLMAQGCKCGAMRREREARTETR